MTIRILSLHENMEDMRKKLSAETNRPAYVISYPVSNSVECRYREQHETEYRERGTLELSLARLTDRNLCVRRFDYGESFTYSKGLKERIPPHTIRNFDLYPATSLYFAVPTIHEENIGQIMNLIHLNQGYDRLLIRTSTNDIVPDELKLFVQQLKSFSFKKKPHPTISFIISEPFMQPKIVQPEWHLGRFQQNIKYEDIECEYTGFVDLHPPGKYSTEEFNFRPSEEWNRMVVCSTKPGSCIVCHGTNNEWNHFGVVDWGGGLRFTNLICKVCLPKAFKSWMKLIDQVNPDQWKLKTKKDI